jgi:hypothetical protein
VVGFLPHRHNAPQDEPDLSRFQVGLSFDLLPLFLETVLVAWPSLRQPMDRSTLLLGLSVIWFALLLTGFMYLLLAM